jgi:hypothetical protein
MNLMTARHALMRERLDWKQYHLRWIPKSIYKSVTSIRRAA